MALSNIFGQKCFLEGACHIAIERTQANASHRSVELVMLEGYARLVQLRVPKISRV